MVLLALSGCGSGGVPALPDLTFPSLNTLPSSISSTTGDSSLPVDTGTIDIEVLVTYGGAPAEGVAVSVGGTYGIHETDAAGRVVLSGIGRATLDDVVIIASHPDARVRADDRVEEGQLVQIDLVRFDGLDNEDFPFQDPGNPDDNANTSKCAHCHETIVADWFRSPHATSASNPIVHDVYAGTAAIGDEEACAEAGGSWWTGLEPGTRAPAARCYLGSGALPDLNLGCGDDAPCDDVAGRTGGCADCHAPAIDGALGGRDLLEATDLAYRYGVHCDLCHKVESVDLTRPAGVGGALHIVRPSEPDPSPVDPYQPLTFGPYGDVPNPRMGAVGRALFYEAELCGACHELHQPALVPGTAVDTARWPSGQLPIHTTYSEWATGPLSPESPCQSCHMPPDPTVGNSADLDPTYDEEGIAGGWLRPPGAVRHHSWPGPRQRDLGLVELAAAIDLDTSWADGVFTVQATVTNAGAGHAIPTGEPLRALLLRVEATCEGAPLRPSGGDVLPDWSGAYDAKPPGDWATWPGATVGDRIRVVARTGAMHDPPGYGPFGDGTFDAAAKGLPVEIWAGESEVVAVDGDTVTLDAPLPAGDVAYRVPALALPADGDPAAAMAGAPGFAFARVLTDADGAPMVPHHRAVDVRSDNRLMPQDSWTSTHTFAGTCADTPTARAVMIHRPLPWGLATQRHWTLNDGVIAEVTE